MCTLPVVDTTEMTEAMAGINIRLNPLGMLVIGVFAVCVTLYVFDVPGYFRSDHVDVNMRDLLSVCIDLAAMGGARVKAIQEAHNLDSESKGKTKEGKDELKTQGDMQSHRQIVYGLEQVYPQLKVVSEEHDREAIDLRSITIPSKDRPEIAKLLDSVHDITIPAKDINVWIDPLDATQEYTENLLHYVTVMVCVAVKGEPIMGVIYSPFGSVEGQSKTDEMVWGWVGHGYSSNLKPAEDKPRDPNNPYNIIVSRSHEGEVRQVAQKAFGAETIITGAGGAGYKTLQVIKGAQDAYVHVTAIKKWDICAGNAILNAVHGRMTTLEDKTMDYADAEHALNDKGLLATLYHHDEFLKHLHFDEKPKQ